MKKLFSLFLLVVSINMFSQQWYIDFNLAIETAKKENKNIVLVFQGSDWCAPCIKLDREIWNTEEYKTLSKDHFIMLKADFPRKKSNQLPEDQKLQNARLAEKYNTQGFFPLVVVLNSDGKILGKLGYEKSNPKAYFKRLTSFEN